MNPAPFLSAEGFVKFYATPPSRSRLSDDIHAFLSLLKFERDEQAERLVLNETGVAPARALFDALSREGKLAGREHPGFEGDWRATLEDPADPYGTPGCRELRFFGNGEAAATIWWDRAPTTIAARFKIVGKGAGFTLAFQSFEPGSAHAIKPAQRPGGLSPAAAALAAKPAVKPTAAKVSGKSGKGPIVETRPAVTKLVTSPKK